MKQRISHQILRTSLLLAALIALWTGFVEAARWVVPAGAHVAGAADTNWRTDLRLVNLDRASMSVTVILLRADMDNSALEESFQVNVPPGGQDVVEDVFDSRFGFSGTGALLVECSNTMLIVTTRTYNQVPGGTYGQFMPGVAIGDALMPGEEGHLLYLAKSVNYRTNVGFAATTATGGQVAVEVYSEDGTLMGNKSYSFLPFGQKQVNDIFADIGAPTAIGARAVVRTTSPAVIYASVIDINTGDPVTVMAVPVSAASADQVLPAAGRVGGAAGSLWRTDLRVLNPNSSMEVVTFTYHAKGVSDTTRQTVSLTVSAGGMLVLDDAMMAIFGLETANGGMAITSTSGVLVYSRTFSQSDTGTFGQSILGTPRSAVGHGEEYGWGFGGVTNVGFRSNAGFFNVGDNEAQVNIALKDLAGNAVGQYMVDLGPGEINQTDDIISAAGIGPGFSGSAVITSDEPVVSYFSIIDCGSNDPTYDAGAMRMVGDPQPSSYTLLKTLDISQKLSQEGEGVRRPDVVAIEDTLYLAYGISHQRNFHLVKLEADLELGVVEDTPMELFSGYHDFAVDIRISKANNSFWYAFEDNRYFGEIGNTHFLNAAWYSEADSLIGQQTDIATGILTGIPDAFFVDPSDVPPNPEAADDPTPLWHNYSYYIFTRAWSGWIEEFTPNSNHHVRVFNENFIKTDDFILDLSTIIPGKTLSQNTLIKIDGQIFLIGGFYDARDDIPGGSSIYAIPLSDDLRSTVGEKIPLLVEPGRWFYKVTAARMYKGKLYINYQEFLFGDSSQNIAVIDVENGYELLTTIEISTDPLGGGEIFANHTTFEILNDRLYVFYPEADMRIYAKIFSL